jgi:glycosyltransferase involved in cell wall biosynthesis
MIVQNEEICVWRSIDSVYPFVDEIVVIDGGSTDKTKDIVRQYSKVKLFEIEFQFNYAMQRNHAIERASHEWVFTIDADEYITPVTGRHFDILINNFDYDGYFFARQNLINGRITNLFNRDLTPRLFRSYGRYTGEHSEAITGLKSCQECNLYIIHDKAMAWQQADNESYWEHGYARPADFWEKHDGEWIYVGDETPI